MPRYLSLYFAAKPMSGPPSQEHMAAMGAMIEEQTQAGKLIVAGGLARADRDALNVSLKGGSFSVDDSAQAGWRKAMGYGIMQGETKQEIIDAVKRFLETAGDGTCELIELV